LGFLVSTQLRIDFDARLFSVGTKGSGTGNSYVGNSLANYGRFVAANATWDCEVVLSSPFRLSFGTDDLHDLHFLAFRQTVDPLFSDAHLWH
jgi:predicted alpha/beta-fold hydrolase